MLWSPSLYHLYDNPEFMRRLQQLNLLEWKTLKSMSMNRQRVSPSCYDPIENTDLKVEDESVDVVLFSSNFKSSYCISMDRIISILDDNSCHYVECYKHESSAGKLKGKMSLVSIATNNGNFIVPLRDLLLVTRSNYKYFAIMPTKRSLDYVANVNSLLQEDYVGADRCQEGTGKQLYRIVKVYLFNEGINRNKREYINIS